MGFVPDQGFVKLEPMIHAGCLKNHCCLNMTDRSLLFLLKILYNLLNFELNFYLKMY